MKSRCAETKKALNVFEVLSELSVGCIRMNVGGIQI